MTELFSNAWAEAWGAALNRSDAYRQAGKSWEGAIVLEAQADPERGLPETAAVYLDLWRGECRAARLATADDTVGASYVISGPLSVWLTVLEGEMAPTMAILRGKLKLKHGSVAGLLPHVHAATELVRVAQSVVLTTATTPIEPTVTADPVHHEHPRPALQSTSRVGLRYDLFPMKLWEKAKRLGIWNPTDIDFSKDREDWDRLTVGERDLLLRLAALFQAGEEAVTIDILPLLDVIASEGRLEEQLYLTSFIWEEAKHVEAIRRFLDAVGANGQDLTHYHSPSYRTVFADALPESMSRLRTDRSPVAQARASATYNMIVEGVLAETGYHVFHRILTDRGIMPGMQQVAAYLKADESRHLAYGIYLLSRLTVAHGDPVWNAIVDRMNTLLNPAIAIIGEAFAAYPIDDVPFGLTPEPFVQFAMSQFQKRMDRVEKARGSSLGALEVDTTEE
ncbi:MAG: R2-like ligand-binding oxidase [Gemmatimonadaceae bacterium]|nr:R2-like ligand-binding oxidase [Gemmatimonadaceae bacterium]